MSYLISTIAFIVIFSILILIHELGHFWMARRAKVKVEEFGLGMPPRAVKLFKKNDTVYSLNWIPFGGFVKMLGEDDISGESAKNPASFQNKTLGQRALILVAGVTMNFLLAVFLLTIGFSFGMEPIMVDSNDVLSNIQEGNLQIEAYTKIKAISNPIWNEAGLQENDSIIAVNDESNSIPFMIRDSIKNQKRLRIKILRQNKVQTIQIAAGQISIAEDEALGLEWYNFRPLGVLNVFSITPDTPLDGILEPGDNILAVNNYPIFKRSEFVEQISPNLENTITIIRNGIYQNLNFVESDSRIIVNQIVPDSPAQAAGLRPNDQILLLNDSPIKLSRNFSDHLKPKIENTIVINRQGEEQTLTVVPDADDHIGVLLTDLENGALDAFQSRYEFLNFSITDHKKVPVYLAPVKAVEESFRLTKMTVVMLGNMIGTLVQKMALPEGVAGPVGIAQLTYYSAQEGLMALIRLCAILSLSLAVINIMPFPALDGGRLVFIFYEILTGRKANQKLETTLHLIGFALLMILIFVVTYNDIVRWLGW